MSRARVILLAAGAAIALLLGAFGGGGHDEAAAPATTTTVTRGPASACPGTEDCATADVAGTTKTTVIVTAAAGALALVWCRRRAKGLAAA